MTAALKDVVIVDALRTPIGRHGGALSDARPDDLLALTFQALIERTGIDPAEIDDVLAGCANQAGEDNRNVARMATILAGFPYEVPAATINRLCGSGLDAVNQASRMIQVGDARVCIAGGVESMTRAPLAMSKAGRAYGPGNRTAYDTTLGWRFENPKMADLFELEANGASTERLQQRYGVDRDAQDRFALSSHRKAAAAADSGRFDAEIVGVPVQDRKGNTTIVLRDEGPRPDTTLDKLASLPPAFVDDGTVTAGNSSSLNDGASAVLVMDAELADQWNLTPLARIVSTGLAGVEPHFFGIAPVPASRQALDRAGLNVDQIDVIELNEAFAAQSIAVLEELGVDTFDEKRVNPNGGAIALGHPLGCSGARVLTTLVHELARRPSATYGLATLCIGVGQGIATVVERM